MYIQNPGDRNTLNHKNNIIKVRGEGEIPVQPDTASVNLGVVTESKELISAQQENSVVGNKVIESLIALGIDKSQIQTFDYRIEPNYDYDQGKQIFRGYKITHILQVKIEDLSIIGKAVDTAVQHGANYAANVQFTTRYLDAYYQQALALALKNANSKATTIANTIRVNLNPIPILVIEGMDTIQPFESQQMAFAKGVSSTQIEPGQLLIKASVSADFKYQSING
ncbi:SIMPL domain-containing protein [Neobacillus niacini]|uniref:SIMPL domain-containing protein n=1 Tax=Neobacillus niacini TaxID=86668 RepID=UPI001C8D402A|nr:SIMPL domain-containing protein [Neobacillus niacini]MBY0145619.1 SIMPL domain-containing protein [Neobacillus niacini]